MANGEQFQRWMFVDFVYAIVLGSALPLINPDHLSVSDPVFYGTLFLIGVILEDYYLYATQIAPLQRGQVNKWALLFEIAILVCWYLAAIAIPKHPHWFLYSFAAFFALKFLAGVAHWWMSYHSVSKALKDWRCWRNCSFFLAILAAAGFALLSHPASVDGWMILGLLVAWVATILIWWALTRCYLAKQTSSSAVRAERGKQTSAD